MRAKPKPMHAHTLTHTGASTQPHTQPTHTHTHHVCLRGPQRGFVPSAAQPCLRLQGGVDDKDDDCRVQVRIAGVDEVGDEEPAGHAASHLCVGGQAVLHFGEVHEGHGVLGGYLGKHHLTGTQPHTRPYSTHTAHTIMRTTAR